jgi:glycosyltransferase involved in cell wall biosynthesis
MAVYTVVYIYQTNKWVSFRFIAEQHIIQLRKYFHVEKVDEKALLVVMPIAQLASKCIFFLHPYFYPIETFEKKLLAKIGKPERLIGVDVADSNHITEHAVKLTEYAVAMVVPSNFSKKAYEGSGVKVPVYVVPHGVESYWIDSPPSKPDVFRELYNYKMKNNVKLMQLWVLHSDYRKGLDLAYKIFNMLIKERKDVALVVRRATNTCVIDTPIENDKPNPKTIISSSFLTNERIKELMDVCDIFLLTSRGGGFEHPALQALSRGEITIGAKGGAWEDYLPNWALVQSNKSDIIFKGNPIHDGYGVEMEVDKAVTLLHTILNNLDDYKAKVRDYINTCVRERFTWDKIGFLLRDIVIRYSF